MHLEGLSSKLHRIGCHVREFPYKMAGKDVYWSWPVLLGAGFFAGLVVGYWIKTRKSSSSLEGRCSEIEVIPTGLFA